MPVKHSYKKVIEKNNYKIIHCKTCGYWHVYPMPTEEELRAYYENKYYLTLGNNHTMSDKSNDPDGFYAIQYEDRLRSIMKFISPSLPASVLDVGIRRFFKVYGRKRLENSRGRTVETSL